ncbi:MAG: EAL domain-containing protein [Bryobacteraceae bacterium]
MLDGHASILLVDDDPNNQDLLSRRLIRAGYAIELASNGYEALDILTRHPVDLILLDSMMPGLSGIELLKIVRRDHSPAQLPIIMVTAVGESERVVEALNLGANDYIPKPVDFPVALARIKAQLDQKRAQEQLRESEERYALAARASNDGLWDWDLQTSRIYFSPRWKTMLGYAETEIGEDPEEWLSRIHKDDQGAVRSELARCRDTATSCEFAIEHRVERKDGSYRWMLSRGVVLRDSAGQTIRMAGSQSDITHNKTFDPLTGLPNRNLFLEKLAVCLERFGQESQSTFAVMFLDLDRFQVVNDSLGHTAGDQLLLHVAQRLRAAVRTAPPGSRNPLSDVIARLGGDEFAILLDSVDNEGAVRIAQRILECVNAPFEICGKEVFTTASIGIATPHRGYCSPAELLRDADTAMYKAKEQGRARFEVFDPEMRAAVVARMDIENDLRRALDNGEFELYYQPKVRLATDKIVGAEALLRWNHPTRGIVGPDEFIPIAEETGLIVPIGFWAIQEACVTARRWHSEFTVDPPLEVSVNVSVRQFRDPDLVQRIGRILQETGLNPASLQLEITESVLMDDIDGVADSLRQLKSFGVGLKIDDFGTGYASLKSLNRLPFDVLKIDRSFVLNMCDDEGFGDTIKTILVLAENLGMEVVAEGIEKKEQLLRLRSLHCDYGQGFYFSPPVPSKKLDQLLRIDKG